MNKKEKFQKLTKAEEEVMQYLWELEEATVREIREIIPEPKPAITTISTIIRILEQKGFIDHRAYGRTHVYFPLIKREEYSKNYVSQVIDKFFDRSPKSLVSFLAEKDKIDLKDLEEIIKELKNKP